VSPIADPDLLHDPVVDLEHRGDGPVTREVPIVSADDEEVPARQSVLSCGEGRAWSDSRDCVPGVGGRRPDHAAEQPAPLGHWEVCDLSGRGVGDADAWVGAGLMLVAAIGAAALIQPRARAGADPALARAAEAPA
jgi:hypothetical protein